MTSKAYTKPVITDVHSHERFLPRPRWLAVIACFFLIMAGAPVFAGTEKRCSDLGSACICGEPLNGATHDGGQTTWVSGQMFNADDSPAATQCFPYPSDPGNELYCGAPVVGPVAASNYAAFLPPGNTLSYLFLDQGPGICHVGHPRIVEQPDMTYCIRAYSRWDPASPMPNSDFTNGGQQQKIMTIGGDLAPGAGVYLNAQISLEPGGNLHTRFDGDMFNAPVDFASLGNASTDCTNAMCRFEICLDYSAIGEGRVRLRRTTIAPGSGQVTAFKPVGNTLRPNGLDLINLGAQGLSMVAQNYSPIRYNSHFIVTHVRPENRSFWPGPACEVEGSCGGGGGSSPVPMQPTGLTVR